MKKIIKILLVCLVALGLTACNQESQDTVKTIKWNKENKLDNLILYQNRLHFYELYDEYLLYRHISHNCTMDCPL